MAFEPSFVYAPYIPLITSTATAEARLVHHFNDGYYKRVLVKINDDKDDGPGASVPVYETRMVKVSPLPAAPVNEEVLPFEER